MKKIPVLLFFALGIIALSSLSPALAQGTTTTVTLYQASPPPGVIENSVLADNASPYMGSGAWRNDPSVSKSIIHISPLNPVFSALGTFTVNDIDSILYATNKLDSVTQADWYVSIYTALGTYTSTCTGTWFCERLTVDPLYGYNRTNPPRGTWVLWDTDGTSNQTIVYDGRHAPYGWYANVPTLAQVQDGINYWSYSSPYWSDTTNLGGAAINYSDQVVLDLVFETGSAWNAQLDGYIDALEIRLKNGTRLVVDLEVTAPPPTPTVIAPICDNAPATDGRLNAEDLCAPIAVFADAGCSINVYETNEDGSLATLIGVTGGHLMKPLAQTGPVCSAGGTAVTAALAQAAASGEEVVITSANGVSIIAMPNGLIKVEQPGLYGFEFDPSEVCFSLGLDPADIPDMLPGTGGTPVTTSPWLAIGVIALIAATSTLALVARRSGKISS